jgi:tetratricopeptide (TPR) repeat protein
VTAARRCGTLNKEPASDQDKKAQADANKVLDGALGPEHGTRAQTAAIRARCGNVGAVHAFMGDFEGAQAAFGQGIATAPNDSIRADLTQALRSGAHEPREPADQREESRRGDRVLPGPAEGGSQGRRPVGGLGDAQFGKARDAQGDARKPLFKAAADSYAKAGRAPARVDRAVVQRGDLLPRMARTCRRRRRSGASVLKAKPTTREALTELSNVLAEQKKYPEAVAMAQKALALDPKDKTAHKQLGAIYNKSQDNLHSKQALLAYLALEKGHEVSAPTPASGAAGTKLAATAGKPDLIIDWDADGKQYETWFYWTKGQAYHFGDGTQLEKTDWSAALASK